MKKTTEKIHLTNDGHGAQRLERGRGSVTDGRDPRNPHETVDALFDGKLRLYQSRRGYRFSLDAVLLAYFATPHRGDNVADLGTGKPKGRAMTSFGLGRISCRLKDASQWSMSPPAWRNCYRESGASASNRSRSGWCTPMLIRKLLWC